MKRFFLILSAVLLSATLVVSCNKDNGNGNGNGSIIDDDTPDDGGSTNADASLKGSAYIPFILDSQAADLLGSKIVLDLRPDDTNKFLYVWNETYIGATDSGLNFYGFTNYLAMQVTAVGWSGAGFFAKAAADPSKKFTGKGWTFHVAYKGPSNVAQFLNIICNAETYLDGSEVKVRETSVKKLCIGDGTYAEYNSSGAFVANHTPVAPLSGKFVPDAWNEYELDLTAENLFPGGLLEDGCNLVTISSGGVQGTPVMLDALFLYKK